MSSGLFYGAGDLRKFLEERRAKMQAEVDGCDADCLLKVREADFREYLVSKYALNPPRIVTDQVYQHESMDVDIDVRHVPTRVIYDQARIRGTAIMVSLPFEGDMELFRYTPLC